MHSMFLSDCLRYYNNHWLLFTTNFNNKFMSDYSILYLLAKASSTRLNALIPSMVAGKGSEVVRSGSLGLKITWKKVIYSCNEMSTDED